MDNLVIVGCSWGCGEYVNSGKILEVSHGGLAEYLSSDYNVTNLSRGGGSNWQSCFALRNHLEYRVDRETLPTVFVIQTDMARTAISEKFHVDYNNILSTSNTLVEYYTRLLEIFYIKLNELANQYHIKIHMIGGITDLDLELISLYNNLIPCCPSWIQLLDKDNRHTNSSIPLILEPKLFSSAKQQNKFGILEEIIDYSERNFLEAQSLMESKFFGPAFGDFHPSREGHKVLAEYVKKYLRNLI